MNSAAKKRQVDFQVIAQWVNEGERVLDLGCGRGVLLEFLQQTKSVSGVGIDNDFDKVLGCVKRGVPVYQGDAMAVLSKFSDASYDRVIFSRTVEQLESPDETISEALRVGKRVTVGFINHAFWLNRVNAFFKGRRTLNEVYAKSWYENQPTNHFSVREFEDFCRNREIRIENRVHLAGDWNRSCRFLPNLMAGYALYDLSR